MSFTDRLFGVTIENTMDKEVPLLLLRTSKRSRRKTQTRDYVKQVY